MSMRAAISFSLYALCFVGFAQTAPDTYWVQFTDKSNTPYSIDQPEQFLSARSIARRQSQGIALDESDLPVDPAYIAAVLSTGDVQLINRSKWFNAITIRTTEEEALSAIQSLEFVSVVRSSRRLVGIDPTPDKFAAPFALSERGGQPEDYGSSFTQIAMLNGHLLHAMDAKGQGMLIGVLDSGFDQANTLPAFDDLRAREGIILTRDMVNHDGDVFADHWHGRSVLSFMAGILPDFLQGTAPLADYVLLRTEEASTEYIVEEDNWVAGAELCDSLGCDVLNTSLGYTTFDDSLQDHTYADMDGQTTRMSIAAGIAAQKGMIPVQSAGNSGSSEWRYIGAPADANGILTVGAVGDQGQYAPFSSRGPSADGRVKPDVVTMGWGAIGLRIEGDSVAPISGTSFSSPILAGLVACLWQLHPSFNAQEIMQAVRQSASVYDNPNDSIGYGIPNFMQAHEYLTALTGVQEFEGGSFVVFPNPVGDRLEVVLPETSSTAWSVHIIDTQGRKVMSTKLPVGLGRASVEMTDLPAGLYLLRLDNDARSWARRVIKQ